jgi:hypothetical protein
MNDIEERAKAQLMVIEKVHDIEIENRDEVASFIARESHDLGQVLTICTALNSWIAVNSVQENIVITGDLLSMILENSAVE